MERLSPWDLVPGRDFENEEIALRLSPTWFIDLSHSWPPMTPMGAWFWNKHVPLGDSYARDHVLSLPHSGGGDKRRRYGATYRCIFIVRDEEEIKRREIRSREAMLPFIEDFDGWWKSAIAEMERMYEPLKRLDLDKATNLELLNHLYDLINMHRRHWQLHMLGLNAVFTGWILFDKLCKEILGFGDQNLELLKLMVGFDNKIFQVDKALWQLAQEAIDRGLADIFLNNKPSDVITHLKQVELGKEWLKLLGQFLEEHGWRMQRMADFKQPTWREDPTPAIMAIKSYIKKGGEFELEKIRGRLARDREEAVVAIMQQVPEKRRGEFARLLRFAQHAGPFSEEHTYYHEMMAHAIVRRGLLGIGRRLAQAGTIEQPEDVLFLIPDEIETVLLTPTYYDLRYIVEPRRKAWEEWHRVDNPPIITRRSSYEEAFRLDLAPAAEPIAEKVVIAEQPKIRPDLNAELYGIYGSPGVPERRVVEGTARVITTHEQLDEIQPGDILVAPNTATSWTPFFSLFSAIVVDRGGVLSHASVVGREYGIPVVTNTFNASGELEPASKRIKTGQKIRVDGAEKVVYIADN